jgi:hypothetical protein
VDYIKICLAYAGVPGSSGEGAVSLLASSSTALVSSGATSLTGAGSGVIGVFSAGGVVSW